KPGNEVGVGGAVAGDRRDMTLGVDPADAALERIGDVDVSRGVARRGERVEESRVEAVASIAGSISARRADRAREIARMISGRPEAERVLARRGKDRGSRERGRKGQSLRHG